jgi:hypothetical protein
MSSSVVTPNTNACASSATRNTWVCASMRPGNKVPPGASTTSAPSGAGSPTPTSTINPSRTTTESASVTATPSKTRAPRIITVSTLTDPIYGLSRTGQTARRCP